MTLYVTDGQAVDLFLWSDASDDEAIYAACALDVDPLPTFTRWWAYRLTWEQWALAVADGAQVVDRWEPRMQMARRDGEASMVALLEGLRARRS